MMYIPKHLYVNIPGENLYSRVVFYVYEEIDLQKNARTNEAFIAICWALSEGKMGNFHIQNCMQHNS